MSRRTLSALLVLTLGLSPAGDAAPTQAPESGSGPLTPESGRRGTEQTFLTFPEWYLVFSPAEYADHLRTQPADEFPFWGHLRQFWTSYGVVARAAGEGHPFNFGYHAMILVIGTSTTVEYAMKSAYETLVGRVARATHGAPVAEDEFAARFARDYVEFIRVRPWYEYDFDTELRRLWTETPLTGPGLIRRWERKYILTTEFLIKAVYARIIGGGTKASYDEEVSETTIVTDRPPDPADPALRALKVLSSPPGGPVIATAPRYQAFTGVVEALSREGAVVEEIAGNRDVILVTVLRNAAALPPASARLLFSQPILTRPGRIRQALVVKVADLTTLVEQLSAPGDEIEHVYDY